MGSIPGSGRSPRGGHDHPLQYSCLENPMDRGSLGSYSPWGLKRVGHSLATKQQQPQHLCLATVRAQHKLWVCSDHQVGMCVTKLLSPHISRGSWTETRECLHPLVRLMLSAGLMDAKLRVRHWDRDSGEGGAQLNRMYIFFLYPWRAVENARPGHSQIGQPKCLSYSRPSISICEMIGRG